MVEMNGAETKQQLFKDVPIARSSRRLLGSTRRDDELLDDELCLDSLNGTTLSCQSPLSRLWFCCVRHSSSKFMQAWRNLRKGLAPG